MNIIVSKEDKEYIKECLESGEVLKEDLRRWFKEKWVDVSKKVDGKHPPCGRKDAEGKSYPKCRPSKKVSKETPKVASSYSKKEKKSMTSQKRRAEKKNPKQGKGNTPTFTRYDESINETFDASPNEYKKILQTKDFLMVVPFTHAASCKYGANTKWCTTKKNDDEFFNEHVSSGLLTYIIVRNPEYKKILESDKFAIYRYFFNGLNDGLVYTDLNDEYNINWFKKLMKSNGLENEYYEIMATYNEYYIENGYMGKNTPIEENRTITLNFDTIVETNTHIKLNSNHGSKIDISEGLKFHIATNKSIIDNVYKKGTDNFNNLLEECRDLYMNGDLELSDDDLSFIMENEYGPIENTNYTVGNMLNEAEYQGRKVQLGKIMQGDIKKFKVYVKNDKGKVVKVNFGFGGKSAKGKRMVIKKNNPARRKSFRARMGCDNPGPRWKSRYWACRSW